MNKLNAEMPSTASSFDELHETKEDIYITSNSNNVSERSMVEKYVSNLQQTNQECINKSKKLDLENAVLAEQLDQLKYAFNFSLPSDDATIRDISNSEQLVNLQKQIELLQSENIHLRQLQKNADKTVTILQQELKAYKEHLENRLSKDELNRKFKNGIELLEEKVRAQQLELARKHEIIRQLNEDKANKMNEIEKLEKLLKERTIELENKAVEIVKMEKIKKQLDESMKLNEKTENALKEMKTVVLTRISNQNDALSRVQEALNIAEEAIKERDEALTRERILKEECDNLSHTIGAVMEEAAHKVDYDLEQLNKKFDKREQILLETIEKLRTENDKQKHHINMIEKRIEKFKQKLRDTQVETLRFQTELQVTKNSLTDMEEKLQLSVQQLQCDQIALKQAEEMEKLIKHVMQSNQEQKSKYKTVFEEIASKFKDELSKLREENYKLNAELQYCKRVLSQTN